MQLDSIEQPRVFISYSWDSAEYKEKVASLATKLMGDGIDVLLDQWEMIEGNDLYAFMEQSVSDDSVTNVLILLSPQYSDRADKRTGGVGAETQIISSQVYGNTDQTKFIPIIFDRDQNGQYSKPTYLLPHLHFDLTNPDTFTEDYMKLVRRLYGHVSFKKPEKGHRPAWVDENSPAAPVANYVLLDTLKGQLPDQVKKKTFKDALAKAAAELVDWHAGNNNGGMTYTEYLEEYELTRRLRDGYLHAMQYYPYLAGNGAKVVGDSLELMRYKLEKDFSLFATMKRTVVYELFLSVVGIMAANEDYKAIAHILNRFYAIDDCYSMQRGYTVFWDGNDTLHNAMRERDEHNYISGVAKLILDRANPELCPKEQLIIADGICFNAALISRDEALDLRWTPKLYIYDHNSMIMGRFSRNLQSKTTLPGIALMFGFDDGSDFRTRYTDYQSEIRNGDYQRFLNYDSLNRPPFLPIFISAEELGTRP